jgi:hypothetical protein
VTRGAREVEKAISRTLRETLDALQRTAEGLNQALNDLVAACGSTRPTNALPPILRAHTAAASLAASLEVLSRFVANSTQPGAELGEEEEEAPTPRRRSRSVAERPAKSVPPGGPAEEAPGSQAPDADALPDTGEGLSSVQEPAVEDLAAADIDPQIDSPPAQTPRPPASDLAGKRVASFAEISPAPAGHLSANPIEELPAAAASFDISTLLPEEQDLHRRANRVAKVCMQDIKMLRPNEVRLGREHRDICVRLRDDIEKAHKEYDRRFQSILGHPVDYFYDWMVEILGEGNPDTLGEYPYPSPVLRR